jgi:hypothetical protein
MSMNLINIKEEAANIVKAWTRYADYLDDTELESSRNCSTHDDFVSYMDGKLFTDKELVQEICKKGESLLMMNIIKIAAFCSEDLNNDYATALAMVNSCSENMEIINSKFKDDKNFILEALKEQNVLSYASERLRDDDEVVHFSVKQNPKTIVFASDRFRTDKPFILELLKKDNYIVEYMHSDLTKDAYFLLDCWKIVGGRCSDSHMLLHGHAKTFIKVMSDELKPLFNHVYLEGPNHNINEQMLAGFNKYLLNKELKQELSVSNKQNKKVKI